MNQGVRDVKDYYMKMVALWQELELSFEERWECMDDSIRYKKKLESGRYLNFWLDLIEDSMT